MEHFKIVHLSDLHFSHGSLRNQNNSHSIDHLLGIQEILNRENYDYIIVTGDISNRGDPESLNQAFQWLTRSFTSDQNQLIGLNCPLDRLIIVPGNHDAYNCLKSGGKIVIRQQKILDHYNNVFRQHSFPDEAGCRYYWISKGLENIFVVAINSSFLGDPEIEKEHDIKNQLITTIGKNARGKLSIAQSERILHWFDLGIQGKLLNNSNQDQFINKEDFRKAFKILVLHHYFFEPPEHYYEYFMSIKDRETVLKNIATADFDLLLCGHKHIHNSQPHSYNSLFPDPKSKGRYVLNMFRRLISIHTLPHQFHEKNGNKWSKKLTLLVEYLFTRYPRQIDENEDVYFERLIIKLRNFITNPNNWKEEFREFLNENRNGDGFVLNRRELEEMSSQILATLTKSERKILSEKAMKINEVLRNMPKRPVVQGMCGSSAKSFTLSRKMRSFSILNIELDDGNCSLIKHEYNFAPNDSDFKGPFIIPFIFDKQRRIPF